ncbi:hypothetical protein AMCSP20_002418 [Streptococcus pneumoniae 2090008]|nr:hypothetical protein AMCSP20_002418 [Streptococcus pneumoniae 2090008]EJG52585.1 hypothetical protein AMCSP01_002214 [Streptococcus pneumoniae 2061376]
MSLKAGDFVKILKMENSLKSYKSKRSTETVLKPVTDFITELHLQVD